MHLYLVIIKENFEDDQISHVIANNEEEIKERIIDHAEETSDSKESAKEYVEEALDITIEQVDEVEGYKITLTKI